jgi:hypothetical protein
MKTHIEMLKEMGVSDSDAEQYLPHLEEALPKYGSRTSLLRCSTSRAVCASTWRT